MRVSVTIPTAQSSTAAEVPRTTATKTTHHAQIVDVIGASGETCNARINAAVDAIVQIYRRRRAARMRPATVLTTETTVSTMIIDTRSSTKITGNNDDDTSKHGIWQCATAQLIEENMPQRAWQRYRPAQQDRMPATRSYGHMKAGDCSHR